MFPTKKPIESIKFGLKGSLVILLGYVFMIILISILTVVVIIFFKPQLEAWLIN